MKQKIDLARRRRYLIAGLLAMALGLVWVAAAAADAADPVDVGNKAAPPIPTARATSVVINADKTVTVTITGGFLWATHGSSCTDDRAGVGYAIDWNDPTQPGNEVKTLTFKDPSTGQTVTDDIQVGAAAANGRNPADNVVHPTRNSKTGNFTGVVDPPSPSTTWRGGCGTAPDSAGRYPDNPAYTTPINTKGVGAGTANGVNQANLPRGVWGPISHTYRQASDISRICALTYDVHKGTDADHNNGVGIPSGIGEVTAGGSSRNTDNGAEKNSGTPLGNACPSIPVPQPNIHVVKDPKQQSVPLLGTAAFKITVSNNGDTDLTNVQITDAQALNCGGSLHNLAPANSTGWDGTTLTAKTGTASYTCLLTNVGQAFTNIATACGDGAGATVCDDDQAAVDHRADVGIEDLTSKQDFVPNDTATLSGAINPLGNITFTLTTGSCTGTSLYSSGPLAYSAGVGSGNTALLSALLAAQSLGPDTAGTYYWSVAYSGDTNADGTQRNAAFSECNETFNINNG